MEQGVTQNMNCVLYCKSVTCIIIAERVRQSYSTKSMDTGLSIHNRMVALAIIAPTTSALYEIK